MCYRPILLSTLLCCSLFRGHAAPTGGNLSNCKGSCNKGERCIGNPFSQPVTDSQCNKCAGTQYWWPCNFETLCYCNSVEEGAPRVPPAPKSRVKENDELHPCEDILTEDIFTTIVQPTSEEGKALFTYSGLCNAIGTYNALHDEKFANMGTEEQMRAELAAFLAHTAVDTRGFSVTREEFHCVDPITGSDGKLYCKPCKEENYNSETKTCSLPYLLTEESYKEYCDVTRQKPPQGCACDSKGVMPAFVPVPTLEVETTGHIDASDAYFTRGAISVNWNYDYYGASLSMTGDGSILCDNPDLVATSPHYAWGVGIYKWMEKMTFGTQGETAHRQVLKGGNFGGTVEVLYGDLECPANQWTSAVHEDMVQERVAQACKSGTALGVYLEMETHKKCKECLKCDGLKKIFELLYITNPDCSNWTQFVRSDAPSVTPVIIESPSFEDWKLNYSQRSAAFVAVPYWAVSTVGFLVLHSVGPLFLAL